MRVLTLWILSLIAGTSLAVETAVPPLPQVDTYEQRLTQKRKEKEVLDIDLEIAQRKRALAELDVDAVNAPTAATFPRLVRMMRFDGKTFGEFAVGSGSVRAQAGDYVNSSWRLTSFERNAAVLTHVSTGDRHIAVLGAAVEERPLQDAHQPPAPREP
jgi:hypothetical protein